MYISLNEIKALKKLVKNFKPTKFDVDHNRQQVTIFFNSTVSAESAHDAITTSNFCVVDGFTEYALIVSFPGSLIKQVLAPLRKDAIALAEKEAAEHIKQVMEQLAKHDWNLYEAYPLAKSLWDKEAIRLEIRYNFARKLVRSLVEDYRSGKYYSKVERCEKRCKKYIDDCISDAVIAYDAYVWKLESKIGRDDLFSAYLEGNHIWSESFLTIQRTNKTRETWKTQCITNRSKYDKFFPQFPTRKLKHPH